MCGPDCPCRTKPDPRDTEISTLREEVQAHRAETTALRATREHLARLRAEVLAGDAKRKAAEDAAAVLLLERDEVKAEVATLRAQIRPLSFGLETEADTLARLAALQADDEARPCPDCPHPRGRHAYNGCADCSKCSREWKEWPSRAAAETDATTLRERVAWLTEKCRRAAADPDDDCPGIECVIGRGGFCVVCGAVNGWDVPMAFGWMEEQLRALSATPPTPTADGKEKADGE